MRRITIVVSIVLVMLMAIPAVAVEFKIGKFEIENTYTETDDADSSSETLFKTTLILNEKIDERVNLFVMTRLDGEFNQAQGPKGDGTDVFVRKGWLNIKDAIGPVDLRVGRMDAAAANYLLYNMKSKYEFARAVYSNDKFAIKVGHNIDSDEKTLFSEIKGIDLGPVDAVTLNYVDADFANIDYNGYSINFLKEFNPLKADLTYLKVENGALEPEGYDLRFSTDKLFSGVNLFLEYAAGEQGIAVDKHNFQKDDSVFVESELNDDCDIKMIKPGFITDLGARLKLDCAYAFYEADDSDASDDYLDLICTYKLSKKSYLEVEYENHNFDDTGTDNTIVTTTLGVNF